MKIAAREGSAWGEWCLETGRINLVVPLSPQRSLTGKPRSTTNCCRYRRWRAREGDSQPRRLPPDAMQEETMQVVYARCAGLDVHKKTVSACISVCEGKHAKQQQTRAFGTFTQDLLKLADWLNEHGVTHVAMEATGVYWRPVWAML